MSPDPQTLRAHIAALRDMAEKAREYGRGWWSADALRNRDFGPDADFIASQSPARALAQYDADLELLRLAGGPTSLYWQRELLANVASRYEQQS